jgi:NTP pyrophosphatase (non-canonical NTP hydrolase)
MKFDEYQLEAYSTAVYPFESRFSYPVLLLASEAGELAGKFSKLFRGDRSFEDLGSDEDLRNAIFLEMGDVLWALSALAHELGVPLSVVAQMNLRKLADRRDRGVIRGSGDTR